MNSNSKPNRLAVIQVGGSQYIVREGDSITAQLQRGFAGKIENREVLLVADGDDIKIGKPHVKGAVVSLSVADQKRGRKLRVLKYKSKTRYRKTIGFRPLITTLKVEKIVAP